MAKCTTQKSLKEYTCEKCKGPINKGDQYHKIVERFRPIRFRCKNCRPARSELTGSGYLSWLWDLQDNFGDRYTPDDRDSLVSELEDQKSELEERLDNMPEGLRDNSDSGQRLQERIDSLDDAISTLDGIDTDVQEYDDWLSEQDEEEMAKLTDDEKQSQYDEFKEERESEILSEMEDAIGGIAE
jgi:hypothetical protein